MTQAARAFPPLRLPDFDEVVVMAAHPDDETLGCGGLVHAVHRSGRPVTVVFASDGEAADPALDDAGRSALAAARIGESGRAVAELARDARVVRMHLPDSALADHRSTLDDVLDPLCSSSTLVLAPHAQDLHPDHEVVGLVAEQIAARRSCPLLSYGIWMWQWTRDDARYGWNDARTSELDDESRRAKRAAMSHYRSQTDDRRESGPVVDALMLERAFAGTETYFLGRTDE